MKTQTEKAYEALVDEVSNFDEDSDRSQMLRFALFHFEKSLPLHQQHLTQKLAEFTTRRKKAWADIIMMGKYPETTYQLPEDKVETDMLIEDILARYF